MLGGTYAHCPRAIRLVNSVLFRCRLVPDAVMLEEIE